MTARARMGKVDRRLYDQLSAPTTPRFDVAISHLTNAANHSKLSLGSAAILGALGGRRGRQTAVVGIVAVGATSLIANLVLKPLAHRARPNRADDHRDTSPLTPHHVPMPSSDSFPSGHTAAAFAFATAVASVWPAASVAPFVLAGAVGYSRVHTGVHYPSDVVLGAALGGSVGAAIGRIHAVRSPRGDRS